MAKKFNRALYFGSVITLASHFSSPCLATTYQTPSSLITSDLITSDNDKADARLCKKLSKRRGALERWIASPDFDVEQLERVATKMWNEDDEKNGCRKDRALAIELLEGAVGKNPLKDGYGDALTMLYDFHTDMGQNEGSPRGQQLRKVMWLRGDPLNSKMNWSDKERRAFVAEDANWAYLSTHIYQKGSVTQTLRYLETIRDPLSPRYDPLTFVKLAEKNAYGAEPLEAAKLLISGNGIKRDEARAEALLLKTADSNDAARALLFPIIRPRLESKDSIVRDDATKLLLSYAIQNSSGPGVDAIRAYFAPIFGKQLEDKNPEVQKEAFKKLTNFAVNGSNEATSLLLPLIKRNIVNGTDEEKKDAWASTLTLSLADQMSVEELIKNNPDIAILLGDGGQLTEAPSTDSSKPAITRFIVPEDYPPRAIREEQEGPVEATVIIAPDGRVVSGFINRGSGKLLNNAVLKMASRRLRKLYFAKFPGRYVMAKLPPIWFSMAKCSERETQTPPGAILVEAYCPTIQIQKTITY
jgi:hypothetical protein